MSDAEPDVALVVDGRSVRELVGLEVDQGGRLAHAVLELAHDLTIDWTSVMEKPAVIKYKGSWIGIFRLTVPP